MFLYWGLFSFLTIKTILKLYICARNLQHACVYNPIDLHKIFSICLCDFAFDHKDNELNRVCVLITESVRLAGMLHRIQKCLFFRSYRVIVWKQRTKRTIVNPVQNISFDVSARVVRLVHVLNAMTRRNIDSPGCSCLFSIALNVRYSQVVYTHTHTHTHTHTQLTHSNTH